MASIFLLIEDSTSMADSSLNSIDISDNYDDDDDLIVPANEDIPSHTSSQYPSQQPPHHPFYDTSSFHPQPRQATLIGSSSPKNTTRSDFSQPPLPPSPWRPPPFPRRQEEVDDKERLENIRNDIMLLDDTARNIREETYRLNLRTSKPSDSPALSDMDVRDSFERRRSTSEASSSSSAHSETGKDVLRRRRPSISTGRRRRGTSGTQLGRAVGEEIIPVIMRPLLPKPAGPASAPVEMETGGMRPRAMSFPTEPVEEVLRGSIASDVTVGGREGVGHGDGRKLDRSTSFDSGIWKRGEEEGR